LVHVLYRIAFRRVDWVFFQNRDDRRLFTEGRLVAANCSERIPGSGVDLHHFAMTPMPEPRSFEDTVFLLIARVLKDKGICEYAEAAARIRSKYPATRFQLLGQLGADNPSAIAPRQLQGWIDSGVIEYLGHHADVRPYIEAAACVVLPSYREGLPRTLLEAGAMGRPIIATDVAGCRDTIDDGINGYLCRVRDVDSLTDTLARFIALPSEHRSRMGQSSRRKMEAEFDESVVISRYLDLVHRLDRGRWNYVGRAD
jgi:glycosyltransferase involved in cell wall biosynthesis